MWHKIWSVVFQEVDSIGKCESLALIAPRVVVVSKKDCIEEKMYI
jgi:hypothetical protein